MGPGRARGFRFGPDLTVGRRTLLEWLLVVATTGAIIVWMVFGGGAERANNLFYDAMIRLDGRPADERVVIVAIDDRSLAELGQWPWNRQVHADMVDRLTAARARAVAYDVLFTEPAPNDDKLAAALARSGLVSLPELIDGQGESGAPWRSGPPVAGLAASVPNLGHVNLTIDGDGVIRRVPLFMQSGGRIWPHLILPLAAAGGRSPARPSARGGDDLVGVDVATIAYPGPPGRFRTVSFVDLLRGETPSAFLKDRLVLVGATAAGLGDRYATPAAPHGELSPGVEIQAALLQTVLEGGGPRLLPAGWVAALSLAPLLALASGFLLFRPLTNMLAGAGLVLAILVGSYVAFQALRIWAPPAAAITGLLIAYPLWSWRRLAVASAYLQSELRAFERDERLPSAEIFALSEPRSSGDVLARQVEAFQASLKQLRSLDRFITETLKGLPDATVVAGRDGQVIMANDLAWTTFGADLGGGANLDGLLAKLGEPAWRRFLTGAEAAPSDIVTPDGRVFHLAAAEIRDADGAVMGSIVRFTDLTHRRVEERQRERAMQLLSHDMRAPQVSILTLLDNPDTREAPDTRRRIADCARQTLSLADGYVQLARAETQPYRAVVFDFAHILTEAADALWPQASAKGATIHISAEEERWVRGDPSMLRRAIVNLLDNALKFGPPGGRIDCALRPMAEGDRPQWTLSVEDAGPGLSEDAVARLFQPFAHGGGGVDGAGLGLAFVRTVAQRLGGQIVYRSTGRGAEFSLTLPQADAPAS